LVRKAQVACTEGVALPSIGRHPSGAVHASFMFAFHDSTEFGGRKRYLMWVKIGQKGTPRGTRRGR